jgi:hypothetical protein
MLILQRACGSAVLILRRTPRVGCAAIRCRAHPQHQRRPPGSSRVRVCHLVYGVCCPPNVNLVVAAVESGADELSSGVDHEDNDDSPMTDGVDLVVVVVVQGLDLGSVFF